MVVIGDFPPWIILIGTHFQYRGDCGVENNSQVCAAGRHTTSLNKGAKKHQYTDWNGRCGGQPKAGHPSMLMLDNKNSSCDHFETNSPIL